MPLLPTLDLHDAIMADNVPPIVVQCWRRLGAIMVSMDGQVGADGWRQRVAAYHASCAADPEYAASILAHSKAKLAGQDCPCRSCRR